MSGVLPNHDQAIGILVGERPEEDAVDHAKDGAVRADAEGEREHGDGGERRRTPKHAQAIAQILHQFFDHMAFPVCSRLD